ncbi:hypothetical protein QUW41_09105 [Slackia piriformis]|nr:hypothetical protein [Slackia piriformis]
MYEYEVVELEKKAKAIVGTLAELEEEVRDRRRANDDARAAVETLRDLLHRLADATDEVRNAARLLNESSASEAVAKLDEDVRILQSAQERTQKSACQLEKTLDRAEEGLAERMLEFTERMERAIDAQSKSFDDAISRLRAEQKEANDTLERRVVEALASMDERIGRIDRNTQKGFGKERSAL